MTTVQKSPARRLRKGFTLLEILITIAIMAMLVGVVVTNLDKFFGEGQKGSAQLFVRSSLEAPLLSYRRDLGDYPSTEEGIKALLKAPEGKSEQWKGPYIKVPGGNAPNDPWGNPYQYRYPGTHNTDSYDLFSMGRDKQPDTPDDIGNW
jgi:general secretion pathway protein G